MTKKSNTVELGTFWGQALLTKVQIMSKDVEFSKTKKVAKFVTI